MTNEEVIRRIRYKAENIKAKLEPSYFGECADYLERYKWHDLRKNPEDLPKRADQVLCEWVGGSHNWHDAMFYHKENGRPYFTIDGTQKFSIVNQPKFSIEGQVIAWRYIEPFEEEEE